MKPNKRIDGFGDTVWELPNGSFHREDGPAILLADPSRSDHGICVIDGCIKHGVFYRMANAPNGIGWYLDDFWHSFDDYCARLKTYYGKTDEDIMMIRMQYDITN